MFTASLVPPYLVLGMYQVFPKCSCCQRNERPEPVQWVLASGFHSEVGVVGSLQALGLETRLGWEDSVTMVPAFGLHLLLILHEDSLHPAARSWHPQCGRFIKSMKCFSALVEYRFLFFT